MTDNVRCPYCQSDRKMRRGFLRNLWSDKTRYRCGDCGKYYSKDEGKVRRPKVLIFDIETSPLRAFIFQKSVWKANVGSDQVISEWFMLCWSAKWLFDDKIMTERLTGAEAVNEDDSRIVKSLWKLLDEADIVIAHNGDSFDVPNMNTRFVVQGLPPTSPYQSIDTKVIAKKQFGFTHNSLDGLAKIFGLGQKITTDFELWKKCTEGDEQALKYMAEYNAGDVSLLEDVYLRLRPWIKSHPNIGLYVDAVEPVCPNCGNTNLEWTGKFYFTQTGKYATFRCSCGAYGRSRKSSVTKEVREALIVGLAK